MGELADEVVSLCDTLRLPRRSLVDGEGGEAQGVVLTKSIERTDTTVLTATALGDKQAVVGQRILVSPSLETRVIDVGCQHGKLGGSRMPEVDEMG